MPGLKCWSSTNPGQPPKFWSVSSAAEREEISQFNAVGHLLNLFDGVVCQTALHKVNALPDHLDLQEMMGSTERREFMVPTVQTVFLPWMTPSILKIPVVSNARQENQGQKDPQDRLEQLAPLEIKDLREKEEPMANQALLDLQETLANQEKMAFPERRVALARMEYAIFLDHKANPACPDLLDHLDLLGQAGRLKKDLMGCLDRLGLPEKLADQECLELLENLEETAYPALMLLTVSRFTFLFKMWL